MKKLVFVMTIMLLAAGAMQAGAQEKKLSVNIKGTLAAPVAGTCASGYASQCVSGNCVMLTPVGTPTVSGKLGKGTLTSMCITGDLGNNVNTPADTDGKATCTPFFGDLTIEVSKTKKGVTTITDTAMNLAGVACHHQSTSPKDSYEAGFGIDGANSTDTLETGWGTATGTEDKTSSAFSLKLAGSSTP
jgi:hypothetical protein